jgi:hypothetical protein
VTGLRQQLCCVLSMCADIREERAAGSLLMPISATYQETPGSGSQPWLRDELACGRRTLGIVCGPSFLGGGPSFLWAV